MFAILSITSSRLHGLVHGAVDTDSDPHHHAFLDTRASIHVLQDGIGCLGFLGRDTVLCIGSERLSVGAVRSIRFDCRDQVLIEEQLTNVAAGAAHKGFVRQIRAVAVSEDVNMRRGAGVVTREGGSDLHHALAVGG